MTVIESSSVILVKRHDPKSFIASAELVAICSDEKTAKGWLKDEIAGKHGGPPYAQGKKFKWWFENGYFSFTPYPFHK